IPNTNLETSYPFLGLMSVVFGPVAGGLIGLIGHTLKDFTTYGSAWRSWIICSGIIAIILAFAGRKMDLEHGEFTTS
ncbi:ECF transporter S component, partial [Enterococcus faecalis]|uniref:ECF transporter S component n=1 Tax=Enterococcus faecalis TaxID=1351 RepID=UPI003D6A81E4